ncbi:MAG: methionine adenosyltransferase [Chloroflexi bacterium]|nr:methionine adenosyltransferase [Chloroflexota bacterium]
MLSRFSSSSYLATSESVTEGHPDKLCDQISDAILDAMLAQDPMSRVACETTATTGLILVTGEVTTEGYVDIPHIIRHAVQEAGYTRAEYGFDYQTCGVMVSLKEQSKDIDAGVSRSREARQKQDSPFNNDDYDRIGAGDQGLMIGYACTETPELMPLPIVLAHRLCKELAHARKDRVLPYLRPDGKAQVTVEYSYGVPQRVTSVVVAAQHDPEVSHDVIERDIIEYVVPVGVPRQLLDKHTKFYINATGRFVIGGPMGDAGLTGRKILVDSYGGAARHGGGCFSGKDPTKVDRSGAYAARYVAKNVVAAGLADRAEIEVAYSIGVAHPLAISVETFGTGRVDDQVIVKLINKHFDLRPAAIIDNLQLRRPIFKATAAYGHFGREDIDAPWERTDKAAILRAEAGIRLPEEGTGTSTAS